MIYTRNYVLILRSRQNDSLRRYVLPASSAKAKLGSRLLTFTLCRGLECIQLLPYLLRNFRVYLIKDVLYHISNSRKNTSKVHRTIQSLK
jgi:hypothetical protein